MKDKIGRDKQSVLGSYMRGIMKHTLDFQMALRRKNAIVWAHAVSSGRRGFDLHVPF